MEQEQERQRPLARRVGLVLLLALLPACGGRGPAPESDQNSAAPIQGDVSTERLWTGGAEGGPYVLVESLSPQEVEGASVEQEEALYRRAFGVEDSLALLRVQVIGGDPATDLGTLLVDGTPFQAFSEPPEDLDPRARLYWHAVSRGGQDFVVDAESLQRNSYIVAAETAAPTAEAALQWRRGDFTIDLTARAWNGRQRRTFLEAPATFEDE
ncbi:MAG: hypothetical protein ACPG31_08910 [Planctomycetota bacterium]